MRNPLPSLALTFTLAALSACSSLHRPATHIPTPSQRADIPVAVTVAPAPKSSMDILHASLDQLGARMRKSRMTYTEVITRKNGKESIVLKPDFKEAGMIAYIGNKMDKAQPSFNKSQLCIMAGVKRTLAEAIPFAAMAEPFSVKDLNAALSKANGKCKGDKGWEDKAIKTAAFVLDQMR